MKKLLPPKRPVKTNSAKTNKDTVPGELLFGIHSIVELLKSGRRKLLSIYTTKVKPKGWEQIERLLPKYPINIQYVERDVLSRIAQTTDHQGIVVWARPFVYRCKIFDPKTDPCLVLIDGVQDPRNLGAIICSAYCTKTDGQQVCSVAYISNGENSMYGIRCQSLSSERG